MTFVHTNVFPATTLHLGGHEDGIIVTYLEKRVDGKMVEYSHGKYECFAQVLGTKRNIIKSTIFCDAPLYSCISRPIRTHLELD